MCVYGGGGGLRGGRGRGGEWGGINTAENSIPVTYLPSKFLILHFLIFHRFSSFLTVYLAFKCRFVT